MDLRENCLTEQSWRGVLKCFMSPPRDISTAKKELSIDTSASFEH